MKEALPVNKEILKWARETIGMDIAEVARRVKKPAEIIKEWEDGISSPTYPMLENLAYNVYRRPVAVFFFPAVPEEKNTNADFRTLPGEVVDTMPPGIIKIYRKAKTYQLNLAELYENRKPVEKSLLDIFKMDSLTNVDQLAQDIRAFLGIDMVKLDVCKTDDDALKLWRDALAHKGIFIFKDAFFNNEFSGLCVYDAVYPVIFLNNIMPKTRQIFTIFHELGHLLLNSGGIDAPSENFNRRLTGDYSRIEQKCNNFAGELIFPKSFFAALGVPFSEDAVIELANIYKVSREVVLRKYLDTGQIDFSAYTGLTDKWAFEYFKRRKSKPGGNPYLTKKAYLGETYITLAFSHYYEGKTSIEGLADYFGMAVKNISTFEGYTLGQV
ncbi:conserved hypothetical protein [Treponema primitia ZAS-2]|uniref:IrrE N-terminal-like domain-containing protein n=1 Tax=Treponema primitia (strain ATCC BAA-887 / DSM 12427 / ZAS-2) TaxID=545694 RepID=F5YQJ7_TREPZ|nr:XRE family transcriptional regulator [Treponema primitia]AEF86713.1 conserved hypothetical protein [Treponema primitia ZAS-2]